eukprot:576689-Pleurochrysis_carterae.AAC.4
MHLYSNPDLQVRMLADCSASSHRPCTRLLPTFLVRANQLAATLCCHAVSAREKYGIAVSQDAVLEQ